ncbi:MAG: hypothetical protein QXD23_01345, partial [Candidatus Micrarchaeaceae archaeon]
FSNFTVIQKYGKNFSVTNTKIFNSTFNLNGSSPINIYQTGNQYKTIDVILSSNNSTKAKINLSVPNINYTNPKGYNKLLSIFNLSVYSNSNSLIVKTNISYQCGVSKNSINPFIFKNNTWSQLTNYTINSTKCVITVVIPKDPIIGIFQNTTVKNSTTVITTIKTIPTTIVTQQNNITNNTKSNNNLRSEFGNILVILTVIISIIIIYLLYEIFEERKSSKVKLIIDKGNKNYLENEKRKNDETWLDDNNYDETFERINQDKIDKENTQDI